uniref:Uncharacterized protein n=1 Tax=Rhizophora mucronata TaxID=61149 RepID=A0A2P2IWU1_RHIMU
MPVTKSHVSSFAEFFTRWAAFSTCNV